MYVRLVPGLLILAAVPFLNGCSSMSHTGEGALAGGAIGAGTGALLSKATGGSAGTGAAVGGLAGAVLGGAIGNEADQRERRALERRAAASSQMGITDVVQWTKAGRSDDLIINQIRSTNSTYQLSSEDVNFLTTNGVSEKVIMEMQNHRPDMYGRRRVVAVPAGEPVYIYRPYIPPPPPPAFGVGVVVHN